MLLLSPVPQTGGLDFPPPARLLHDRGGRTRTCFLRLPGSPSRRLRPHRAAWEMNQNGSDGTCTHLTLLARQHRPCGTCAPFTKGKMAGSEGIEPSKHEIWSLAAIPTRRQPAYKHFFPLPLVTAPANAIQKVEAPHTTSTCTTQDSVSWPPGSKAYWQHAFS